jgi:hypothetical protein
MTRIGRRAARLALRLHPRAWRERYGFEMAGLIDDSDSSLADAADLARSAIHAHATGGAPMRFEPAHRHPGAFALVAAALLLPTFLVVGLSYLGHELGFSAVANAVDPWIAQLDDARALDLFLVLAPAIAFLVALVPLLDLRIERDEPGPALAVRVRAIPANLVVGAVALLVGAALVAHIVVESVLRLGA